MKVVKTEPSIIKGKVKISGSKNASLPIIVASLLNEEKTILRNVPFISDVENLFTILNKINVCVIKKNHKLIIKPNVVDVPLFFSEVKSFRASYYFMGLYLALFDHVKIYAPGGCRIGKRPIDFHIEGFKLAGCNVIENDSIIEINRKEFLPFVYKLPKKSLGATVNLMLIASKTEGKSIIENASAEPEIDDLINFMSRMGINVFRDGESIIINGEKKIRKKLIYTVMPDRIEAFTFAVLGAMSPKLCIKKINISHLRYPLYYLKKIGVNVKEKRNRIIISQNTFNPIMVSSGDFPNVSTDQLPLFFPLLIRANGTSKIVENIFENRFGVCDELIKTGAEISISGNVATIVGKNYLQGSIFNPMDLRASACLLIEAIFNGCSTLTNLKHLERGYDDIYNKLKQIGVIFSLEEV